jgi:hypothetical protein
MTRSLLSRLAPGIAQRPEHDLLLLSARVRREAERADEAGRLAALVTDWDYFYALARRHAVVPVVNRQLKGRVSAHIPPAIIRRFRDGYAESAARAILLSTELGELAALFESEGVPLTAYKGPALGAYAYGHAALRRFVDLDVIVRREQVPAARELLRARGYEEAVRLTPAQEALLLRGQHNLPFTGRDGGLTVELHWSVASRLYAREGEAFWGRLVTVKLGAREVRCLSPEDHLLALAVHGTKHFWERLGWICDIAELLRCEGAPDLSRVMEMARAARSERMVLLALLLAHELLDAPLDEDLSARARADRGVTELARRTVLRLFDGAEHTPAGLLSGISYNLLARTSMADRLRYFGFAFTPTDGDMAAISLPPKLTFAYYLIRPFRLLFGGDSH